MSIFNNAETPAYPVDCAWDDGEVRGVQTGNRSGWAIGLTKREHFAALAMQGLLASESPEWGYADNADKRARDAVANADALLAELAKAKETT